MYNYGKAILAWKYMAYEFCTIKKESTRKYYKYLAGHFYLLRSSNVLKVVLFVTSVMMIWWWFSFAYAYKFAPEAG